MKRFISILMSLILVICLSLAFVGCGGGKSGETGEVDAGIYDIKYAYECGWLDDDDLESIACRQYECYGKEENPYAGMFTQQTEISAKAEKDFKKVFCKKYNIEDPSDLEIVYYYGTYEGNVVVEDNYGGLSLGKHIGGVVFSNDDYRPIRVLHYTEYGSESATVTGRLYDAETAYGNGWLNEDDLKSIACCYYDYNNAEENPYSGMYVKPAEKLSKEMKSELKNAYLRQIAGTWSTRLDDAYLYKYFGTYNGNIVVGLSDDGCVIGAVPLEEIGGITNIDWSHIYVYRFFADGV